MGSFMSRWIYNTPNALDDSEIETYGSNCRYYFTLKDYISGGAFGKVYRATVTDRGDYSGPETVAVKIVDFDKMSRHVTDKEKWIDLQNRLKLLLELQHNHLARYHKAAISSTYGGISVQLMMSYYNGGNLASLLEKQGESGIALYEATAIRYATEITAGVEYLHQRNIIHGDLKPANVLVQQFEDGSNKLLVADLDDLVPMERSFTYTGFSHIRGTFRYMSPEMLRKQTENPGQPPGRKTDIWSLGCILLELAESVVLLNDKKWLIGPEGRIEAGGKLSENNYVIHVIKGYFPFMSNIIPRNLADCIRNCLYVAAPERLHAGEILSRLQTAAEVFKNAKPRTLCEEYLSAEHFADTLNKLKISPAQLIRKDSEILLIYGQSNTVEKSAYLFEPTTCKLRKVVIPTTLQGILSKATMAYVAVGSEVIFQTKRKHREGSLHREEIKTFAWNVMTQECRLFYPNIRWMEMCCPVAVGNMIYFWDPKELLGISPFKALDMSQGCILAMKKPPLEEWRACLNGVRYGFNIIYTGIMPHRSSPNSESWTWMAMFNTLTGKWENLTPLPGTWISHTLAVVNNFAYILGGDRLLNHSVIHFEMADDKQCLRLNLRTRTWERAPDLLEYRSQACAFVSDQHIYLFGGLMETSSVSASHNVMAALDTVQKSWSQVSLQNSDGLYGSDIIAPCALYMPVTDFSDSSDPPVSQ